MIRKNLKGLKLEYEGLLYKYGMLRALAFVVTVTLTFIFMALTAVSLIIGLFVFFHIGMSMAFDSNIYGVTVDEWQSRGGGFLALTISSFILTIVFGLSAAFLTED